MTDLIERQAAIDEIKALYEWHDTVTEDRTIDHLKRLPSAQPDIPTNTPTDCISRQDAIDAVGNMLRRKFGVGGDLAEITIAGLPSAQPEPCDFCKHQNDCGDMALYCPAERKEGEEAV